MQLPKDPYMLLSVVNTQLRDHYASFQALASAYMAEPETLTATLASIGYQYEEAHNQFIATR